MEITKQSIKKCFGWTILILFIFPITACTSTANAQNRPGYQPYYSEQSNSASGQYAQNNHSASSYVVKGKRYYVLKSTKGYDKTGYATWYGHEFHGHKTFNDERYNMYAMTAASTTLPINSFVRITNLQNHRTAVVRINDRGPFRAKYIIDLSYAAAKQLGFAGSGTAYVNIKALENRSEIQVAEQENAKILAENTKNIKPKKSTQHVQLAENKVTANKKDTSLYLHVGSYKSKDKAMLASKKIAALTKSDVAVEERYHNHGKVYQVHIGPLADSSKSKKVKQLLQQHGYSESLSITG